jgi:uncharacterized membrane protein YdfJ with MMPL/SSD domain
VIAFGVLLDTFIVRSVLVPALVLDIGPRIWWPSSLARTDGGAGTWRDADTGEGGEPGDNVQNGRVQAAEPIREG